MKSSEKLWQDVPPRPKQLHCVHQETFGNKGRGSEQASVANNRHQPGEFSGASKRDVRDSRFGEG
jgi:hypothetical protein